MFLFIVEASQLKYVMISQLHVVSLQMNVASF